MAQKNIYIHYKQKDLDTSYEMKCYEVYNASNQTGDLKRGPYHHPEEAGQGAG